MAQFPRTNSSNGKGNGVSGQVLQDLTKPSYDELVAMVASLQADKANTKVRGPSFTRNKEGKDSFTFAHNTGEKGVYPWISAPGHIWRIVLDNVKMIDAKLKEAGK